MVDHPLDGGHPEVPTRHQEDYRRRLLQTISPPKLLAVFCLHEHGIDRYTRVEDRVARHPQPRQLVFHLLMGHAVAFDVPACDQPEGMDLVIGKGDEDPEVMPPALPVPGREVRGDEMRADDGIGPECGEKPEERGSVQTVEPHPQTVSTMATCGSRVEIPVKEGAIPGDPPVRPAVEFSRRPRAVIEEIDPFHDKIGIPQAERLFERFRRLHMAPPRPGGDYEHPRRIT